MVVNPSLILGSASPRRAALLDRAGISYVVRTADIDEAAVAQAAMSELVGMPDLGTVVASIALAKYHAIRGDTSTGLLLTADTMVGCNGQILGKPSGDTDVARMLNQMSGSMLDIVTAVCRGPVDGGVDTQQVATNVRLRDLSISDIAAYVETGAGLDKAAALALQSEANHFIERVDGCWSNVLGLPICVATDQLCSVDLCGGWR